MNQYGQYVQQRLGEIYDIPFNVETGKEYGDLFFIVSPKSDMNDLFTVRILFRQNIRLIIEIQPQKYAAGMLDDMYQAADDKKVLFRNYLQSFIENRAAVTLYLNGSLCDIKRDDIWNRPWKQFKFRATKIMTEEDSPPEENVLFWADLSVGLMLSLLNLEQTVNQNQLYPEGKAYQVHLNKYERNPVNRKICLQANGYTCHICGFDFEKVYGEIGRGFIHVHHIEPVASFRREYLLDPVKDLIPVCPNCHAMLHRLSPPMKPEHLRKLIMENISDQGDSV